MEYRNQKTGAMISTDCIVSGGDWEPVRRAAKGSGVKSDGEAGSSKPDSGAQSSKQASGTKSPKAAKGNAKKKGA